MFSRFRRPSVRTILLFLALSLVLLLVGLYNDGTTDNRHGPASHNSGVLNIQQKVSKFEQQTRKGQRQNYDTPSRTKAESNSSDDSYLPSSSNFSDEEVKERPSDITGDNAREVRVSSDGNPHESNDNVHKDHQIQHSPQVGLTRNYARVLNAHTDTKVHNEELVPKETIKERGRLKKRGSKRTFLHEWNERDQSAWRTLPMVTGLNETETPKGIAVIYNRVGKCGSRSVLGVLRALALKNRYHMVSSLVYDETKISSLYEKKFVSVLNHVERPYLYQRHLYFVDFRRYRAEQPKYINIIRDPLSRMVSQYYFQRFGDGKGGRNYQGDALYQTFDMCVKQNKPECYGQRTFYIVPYFCGQDSRCRGKTMWAVDEAIRNVEDNYLVVGLLEELEDTLKVFEKLIPEIFNGVMEIYKESVLGEAKNNITKMTTKHKVPPSPEVVRKMKDVLELEYIFYEFVKTRFHKQKRQLGIS